MNNKKPIKSINFSVYLSVKEKHLVQEYKNSSEFKTLTAFIYNYSTNKNYTSSKDNFVEITPLRNVRITIRLTPAEHDEIKNISSYYNLTTSEYVRKRILKQKIIKKNPPTKRTENLLIINRISNLLLFHYSEFNGQHSTFTKKIRKYLKRHLSCPDSLCNDFEELRILGNNLAQQIHQRKSTLSALKKLSKFLGVK
ncbi:plasmid mobilization protein [Endozoicomonas ascidiicola]|uniref:plasmid mobilization protein n=1 Tax=Endozoicomonas ascidiicola TaxID=1698521 RepID=UPI0008300BA5|nr:hypothetical protein [Endozoicomonas ascidiicola]